MKRATLLGVGAVCLITGLSVSVVIFAPKERIELSLDGNKITWIDNTNKDLIDCRYEIYNDDFSVAKLTDKSYFITKEKLIDEVGPDVIKSVNMKYEGDSIYFKWDDIEDRGTENSIWVGLYNDKGKQLSYSNVVNMDYASGIYRYIVELNGVRYEAINNEFFVDRKSLPEGLTKAKLYAIDRRGNMGQISEVPLYNYNVNTLYENNYVVYSVEDKTQSYRYKWFLNGVDKGDLVSSNALNAELADVYGSEIVSNVDVVTSDKRVSIEWKEVSDVSSVFKVKIDGVGEKYGNTVFGSELVVDKTSGLKGYHYAINQSKDYSVTVEDTFVTSNVLENNMEYGEYYFHISSIDNAGNLSPTKTVKFKTEAPPPPVPEVSVPDKDLGSENKPDDSNKPSGDNNKPGGDNKPSVDDKPNGDNEVGGEKESFTKKGVIYTGKDVREMHYKVLKSHMDLLSPKVRTQMADKGVKLYITSGEAEDLYKELTGNSLSGVSSYFYVSNGNPIVIFEDRYINGDYMSRMSQVVDVVLGDGKYTSSSKAFNTIFAEEKESIFAGVEMDTRAYFGKSYEKMFVDKIALKENAPKTYWYIYNRIFE